MSDEGHDPLQPSDEDILALLNEAAGASSGRRPDDASDVKLDVGALEAIVFEEEANLANLLPGYTSETGEPSPGEPAAAPVSIDHADSGGEVPLPQTLNIIFGPDTNEGMA